MTPERILQVGLGFWASKTLLSAVELGVFTALAERPGGLEEVRDRLGLHPRSAADFLDALVALGFLEREGGVYENAPDADRFLDRRKPDYIGGFLEMASGRVFRFWGDLTEALRTGAPQSEAKGGESLFDALYTDPERRRDFLRAMTGLSHPANVCIAERFPWDRYATFVDVGTAQGDLAVQIAIANPHLTGQGLDLPDIAPVFEEYVARHRLEGRLTFTPGDFFDGALPAADVITMGHILHDWDLAQKRELIAKAFAALPEGGSLIVYESIIDDDRRENAFGLLMSLNMLLATQGGFDYTAADCRGWMAEAGFRETRAEHLVGSDSMVVGVK